MMQVELFEKPKDEFWEPIPGMPGYYIMSEENQKKARLSYDQLRETNPAEWLRIETIKANLKAKLDKLTLRK